MSGLNDRIDKAAAETVARARTLPLRVIEAVRRADLWAPGDRVLLAVSGGLDSTVLLHLLAQNNRAHGGRLEVCSVDHGLRPEAATEVEAVGREAAAFGLPFHPVKLRLKPGPNLQARARDARRAALLSFGADRIATAHQQDDQAETVLLALLRGSGSHGLRGMQPLDPPWCRPLLGEPRAVLEAWARQHALSWFEDPSNPDSVRGTIRRIMPALDEIHGGAAAALTRSGRLLAREDAFLDDLTDQAWARLQRDGGLDWEGLTREHEALRLRLLRRLAVACPGPVRADQLEAALGWHPAPGASLPLPQGWRMSVERGVLRALPPEQDAASAEPLAG